jgi:hypothetical protein
VPKSYKSLPGMVEKVFRQIMGKILKMWVLCVSHVTFEML